MKGCSWTSDQTHCHSRGGKTKEELVSIQDLQELPAGGRIGW